MAMFRQFQCGNVEVKWSNPPEMGPLQQMGLWLRWLPLWLCEAVAIILILSFSVSSLCLPPKIKRFDSSRWGGGSDGHLYDFAKRQSGSLSKKFDPSRWLLLLVLLFFLPSRLCCCFCYCFRKVWSLQMGHWLWWLPSRLCSQQKVRLLAVGRRLWRPSLWLC